LLKINYIKSWHNYSIEFPKEEMFQNDNERQPTDFVKFPFVRCGEFEHEILKCKFKFSRIKI
jgi:hypothetical protein